MYYLKIFTQIQRQLAGVTGKRRLSLFNKEVKGYWSFCSSTYCTPSQPTKATSMDTPQAQPGSGKRAKARVRFSDDAHRIVLSNRQGGPRNFPPPSPAPAHLRRRKPMYRPVTRALEVLIVCLVIAILVLMATWASHVAHLAYSSSSWACKPHLPERFWWQEREPQSVSNPYLPSGGLPPHKVH
jgi:hypothetical protein